MLGRRIKALEPGQGNSAENAAEKGGPIVFVNRPIHDKKDDIVGFSTQVDTICEAVKDGSTMIGVIADYGSGKSSMTELLGSTVTKEPYQYPEPIKINMWDCLLDAKRSAGKHDGTEQEVSEMTKSFLYQLAGGGAKHRHFSSYVNKRLSQNYGNISFSISSWKAWIFFALAVLSYALYLTFANEGADFGQFVPDGSLAHRVLLLCGALSPLFRLIAGVLLLIGIIDTTIAFSNWKIQNGHKTEVNDVFDVYAQIVRRIRPLKKGKKQLIIIEDLDRVVDKAVIIGFLKELYRCRSAMRKYADRFVFIVSIKPESMLCDDSGKLPIDDGRVYSKLFDTIIPLKPIHYDDYDSILLKLINGDEVKKARLEALIKEPITDNALPKSFYWLKKGQNLTLRDLKDRLNHAIAIMSSRQSYQVKTAVTFEACAAVTYLESAFPKDYYALIEREDAFAGLMSASVGIINAEKPDAAADRLTQEFYKRIPKSSYTFREPFITDLIGLICDGVFNYDFRMYFYTYPSGSHIKTTEERILCDMLLMPARFCDYDKLAENASAVYGKGASIENVVTQTMDGLSEYPKAVLMDDTLLCVAGGISWTKTADAAIRYFIEQKVADVEADAFWRRIYVVNFPNKSSFIDRIKEELVSAVAAPDGLGLRRCVVRAYGADVIVFQDMFSTAVGPKIPQITEQEISDIGDMDVVIRLIEPEKLSKNNFEYISKSLCSQKLYGNTLSKALSIMRRYGVMTPEGFAEKTLAFLHINALVDDKLFSAVFRNCDRRALVEYLNTLAPGAITEEYLDDMEIIGFSEGLTEAVLRLLAQHRKYKCVLLHAATSQDFSIIDASLYSAEHILADCEWIRDEHLEAIPVIRQHFCVEKDNSRYAPLYGDTYPLVTKNEYLSFQRVAAAINSLNITQLDERNYSAVLDMVYARSYDFEALKALFAKLFDLGQYADPQNPDGLLASITADFDFKAVHVRELLPDERDEVYELVHPAFRILKLRLSEQLRQMNCLVPSVEKKLAEKYKKIYCDLVNELDEFTPFTLSWLQENYLHIPLSRKLCDELKAAKDYKNYIVASVLREKEMIKEEDIPWDIYRDVYCKVPELYGIMSTHGGFLDSLQTETALKALYGLKEYEKFIRPVYQIPQRGASCEFMLSDRFTDAEKKEYLDSISELAGTADSTYFISLLCSKENIGLLDTRERYEHIRNMLWSAGNRALLTRKWNEYWDNQLERV